MIFLANARNTSNIEAERDDALRHAKESEQKLQALEEESARRLKALETESIKALDQAQEEARIREEQRQAENAKHEELLEARLHGVVNALSGNSFFAIFSWLFFL